jgi:hypothetical protein
MNAFQVYVLKLLVAILERLMYPASSFTDEINRTHQLLAHHAWLQANEGPAKPDLKRDAWNE